MASKKERKEKIYRLLYVDNFHTRAPIDLIIRAYNKPEAEAKGQKAVIDMAAKDLRLITDNSIRLSADVVRLSPDYFGHLVYGCWTLIECEVQIAVSAHESKRSAEDVYRAADKRKNANGKKRRWTKAEKEARKNASVAGRKTNSVPKSQDVENVCTPILTLPTAYRVA
jgi:hypothetical protein